MSRYIKLEDAIKAYNQAVKKLVEYEMEEFDLGDFTECQFDTTQIKLIARMIESLPTIDIVRCEDCRHSTYTVKSRATHETFYACPYSCINHEGKFFCAYGERIEE